MKETFEMKLQTLALVDISELEEQIKALENEIEVIEARKDAHEDWDRSNCFGKITVLRHIKQTAIPASTGKDDVEQEKLKFAIEQLNDLSKKLCSMDGAIIIRRATELQTKLKELK